MLDIYTKTVLTIIAAALSVIASQQLVGSSPAVAQLAGCGGISDPCYVDFPNDLTVYVEPGSNDLRVNINR